MYIKDICKINIVEKKEYRHLNIYVIESCLDSS
jgi:hypothetical protein